jgi:serralysin
MNNGAISAAHFFNEVGNDWHILGVGDFNGDGKSDILWHNEDGSLLDWQMSSSSQIGSQLGVGSAPANSELAGIGDFDGDHKDDLLWRNETTGAATVQSFSAPPVTITGVGNEWSVVGAGDFNGDGVDDVMFRNAQGVNAAWLMNGTNQPTTVFYSGVPADWHVVGTGDFDGNGTADLFWHNDNGANAVWLMNTSGAVASTSFFDGVASDWHVIGTGDVNNDQKDDVIWRNDSGATAIWQMDGGATPSVSFPGGVPTDWGTQAHHYDYV